MQYIFELGRSLYFRRKIPLELREELGISEIRRSLHTQRMEDAKAIAAHLNQKLEKIFVAVASGVSLNTVLPTIDLKLRKRRKASVATLQTVSTLYQRFSDEMTSTRQWNEKTENENRLAFNLFLNLVGDIPYHSITHAMLMEYRSMVQRLPPNATKAKSTRGTSLRELLQRNHQRTLTITRVNHILIPLSGLFRWLHKHEFIMENPAHNLLLPKGRRSGRADEERKRYTNEEIRSILKEVQNFKTLQPERYWVPLICAFSAMRVSECCQLGLDNIRNMDGIWVFDICEGNDRRLKSRSAARIIPVHPFILCQGFLAYADKLHAQGEKRLFPRLRKHRRNGYGHQIIQWWGRIKTRISNDKKLSFHSIRHSACSELKNNLVEPAIIAEIMGHSTGSITMERYGKRFSPHVLLEAIKRITFDMP